MPTMRVHIISEALPPLALAAVCRDAHALADCDNFWVTKVSLNMPLEPANDVTLLTLFQAVSFCCSGRAPLLTAAAGCCCWSVFAVCRSGSCKVQQPVQHQQS